MAQNKIALLDPLVIDHIAAGEVVERPASIVKELLENALDAGAQSIDLDIGGGGMTHITLTDDGSGMSLDDAHLCLKRHATSKLRATDDLFQIETLGFRGEAMASIAAISELTLTTREADAASGHRLTVRGGTLVAVMEVGCPQGTTLDVRDIFFNTPARRKFMRAPATEQAHVVESAMRVILGARRAGLILTSQGRRLLDIPSDAPEEARLTAALGQRFAQVTPILAENHGVRVSGSLGVPSLDRAEAKAFWFFVNGRFIRDRMLQRAAMDALRDSTGQSRMPAALIYIDVAPQRVDVNVHPQKLEVRFADPAAVFSMVVSAVAGAVERAPWAQAEGSTPHAEGVTAAAQRFFRRPVASRSDDPMEAARWTSRRAPAAPDGLPKLLAKSAAPVPQEAARPALAASRGFVVQHFIIAPSRAGALLIDWPEVARSMAQAQLLLQAHHQQIEPHVLLFPEAFAARHPWALWLEENWESLRAFGFEIEPVAPGQFITRVVPSALTAGSATALALTCVEEAYAAAMLQPRLTLADSRERVLIRCAQTLDAAPDFPQAQKLIEAVENGETMPEGMTLIPPEELQRLCRARAR